MSNKIFDPYKVPIRGRTQDTITGGYFISSEKCEPEVCYIGSVETPALRLADFGEFGTIDEVKEERWNKGFGYQDADVTLRDGDVISGEQLRTLGLHSGFFVDRVEFFRSEEDESSACYREREL